MRGFVFAVLLLLTGRALFADAIEVSVGYEGTFSDAEYDSEYEGLSDIFHPSGRMVGGFGFIDNIGDGAKRIAYGVKIKGGSRSFEGDLSIRLFFPVSFLDPYFGVDAGYGVDRNDGEVFRSGSSVLEVDGDTAYFTASVFAGVGIRMTKTFSLLVQAEYAQNKYDLNFHDGAQKDSESILGKSVRGVVLLSIAFPYATTHPELEPHNSDRGSVNRLGNGMSGTEGMFDHAGRDLEYIFPQLFNW